MTTQAAEPTHASLDDSAEADEAWEMELVEYERCPDL